MKVTARTSQFAQALLQLKGRPLSFEKYKPFELIYDMDVDMMVLKAGRQVGKSVSTAGRIVTKSISRQYFNSLYVAPLQAQTKRFSSAYVDAFMESPLLKKHFKQRGDRKNVFEKSFSTGSTVYLAYASDEADADRIRGIMTDQMTMDEVQDISHDAIAPIKETMSASEYAFEVYSGTSKSTSNTLEYLWRQTNMMEWVVKCDHCGKWAIPDNFETCVAICSDPRGPVCPFCRKPIDMSKGHWAAAIVAQKKKIGFHLPQMIMTANTSEKKWPKLFEKVDLAVNGGGQYSPATLANEVFGLATDLAGKTLSIKEAMACCNPEATAWHQSAEAATKKVKPTIMHTVLGIDWSVTGSDKSYTVMSVLGYDLHGKCYLLYGEKIQGTHILTQVERAKQLFNHYRCAIIGSDRGVGVLQAQILQRDLGLDKCIPINYVSSKAKLRWDTTGGFMAADRTQAIDNVVMKIRSGQDRFETPCWEITKGLWQDALNIYEEETLAGNRVYRHHPDEPDDWIHSVVFGNVAYQALSGDYEYLQ